MAQFASRQPALGVLSEATPQGTYVELSAATQLTVQQRRVKATANTANPSWTLTLPPVVEAAGLLFSIVSVIADVQAVTVTDAGDDANFVDLTLDTTDDAALLMSDGNRWWVLVNDIA